MVRRWSRLNTTTPFQYLDYRTGYQGHHVQVFRTTTYFKRFFVGPTKQKRRKSAQKKRLSFLTPHVNVISSWSSDYRMFRHLTRFNHTNNTFLVNCIATNNVPILGGDVFANLTSGSFITATYAQRASRYYIRQQASPFFLHKASYDALYHTLSTYDHRMLPDVEKKEFDAGVVSYSYQKLTYDTSINPYNYVESDCVPLLVEASVQQNTHQIILIYRTLILTYLNTLQF